VPPEKIRLPAAAWTEPEVRRLCATADGPALLRHLTTHYGITQGQIAYWMGAESGYISKTINGKTGRIRDLDRWRRIADALNMPAANRALIVGADDNPAVDPGSSEPATPTAEGTGPVQRRDFLGLAGAMTAAVMMSSGSNTGRGAGPVSEMEAVRREANELLGSGTVTDLHLLEWDATIATFGRASRHAPVEPFLAALVADFSELQNVMRLRQPTRVQIRLCRNAAQLAGLVSLTLTKLSFHRAARQWGRTAWLAAEEAGEPDVRSWVRAQEAYAVFYSGVDRLAAIEAAQEAQRLAHGTPMVGAVLAAALEARVHAQAGDQRAAEAALAAAEDILSGLRPEHITDSAFGYNEAQLRYHEGSAMTLLGQPERAWAAQDHALTLYPHADLDRTYIQLDRSDALATAGDTAGATTSAVAALVDLPAEHRNGLVLDRARLLHGTLSRTPGAATNQLTELHDLITDTPTMSVAWR
jgi:hypothetical protein